MFNIGPETMDWTKLIMDEELFENSSHRFYKNSILLKIIKIIKENDILLSMKPCAAVLFTFCFESIRFMLTFDE